MTKIIYVLDMGNVITQARTIEMRQFKSLKWWWVWVMVQAGLKSPPIRNIHWVKMILISDFVALESKLIREGGKFSR